MVIVSVPHGLLYPTTDQMKHLQARAEQDKGETPASPRRCYAVYNTERFRLSFPDGKESPGFAIGPLPVAYDAAAGGFNAGTMVELCTSAFDPRNRALVAVVWEVPTGSPAGSFRLRFDAQEPIAVPALQLTDYRGAHSDGRPSVSGRRGSSDLLIETRSYSKY